MKNMLSGACFSSAFLLFSSLLYCSAIDSIRSNSFLSEDGGETLVSAGKMFELGFFTPAGSSDNRRYVGIWCYRTNPRIVVWVANRNKPLSDNYRGGVFSVAGDGNLKVLDRTRKSYWETGLEPTSEPSYREAKLLDSGNLILIDNLSSNSLWQSFEFPTNTFLSGMKMYGNLNLTSWRSQVDPAEGNFTFKLDANKQFVIFKDFMPYWSSGKSGDEFNLERMPGLISYFLSNFSTSPRDTDPKSVDWKVLSPNSTILSPSFFTNTRIVLDIEGEIQYWSWDKNWSLQWWEPRDKCGVLNACGNFGSCNVYNRFPCKCLPGFEPSSPDDWKNGDFTDGCFRSSRKCGKTDAFLSLKMMRVGPPKSTRLALENETVCREKCLNVDGCQCVAYSFTETQPTRKRTEPARNICSVWIDNLKDLQEEYSYGSYGLSVRVGISDIESTARSCAPCGTNVIPYPLSTGSACGDPMYFSFSCNNSTAKFSFKTPTGTYNVTSINPNTRTFIIQDEAEDDCNASSRGEAPKLNVSLPFKVNSVNCSSDTEAGNFRHDVSSQGVNVIEIGWEPPLEPFCTSFAHCKDWPHSTCKVTGDGTRRCHCNTNFKWDGVALNCTVVENTVTVVENTVEGTKKHSLSLIVGITIACVILLSSIFVYIFIWRRKKAKRRESEENAERNAAVLYGTEKRVRNLIDSEEFKEEDKTGIDVPFFDLDSILAATDNFSDANRLGRGGFGPVYKGKFPGSQEIAIKRLSSVSGQGLEEFKNEVVLIARLQHRNLVRLVGYCIKGDEKILLYEYMPNKSLDFFIFDRNLSILLNWEMRFNIILGVARGLLYLHQDSRLRIVHRDLKTSNILVDGEMNPKISDFGLARMFEGKQTEGSTNRVVGTYGYMSPEYALDGLFSVKSDAFSFGVVVLEILSGKRNTGYFKSEESLSLLGYAWRLWREEKALDLMDETLRESCKTDEFLRCVKVALLCVQDDPADRPTMSSVVVLLCSEVVTFPIPKKPVFFATRSLSGMASSSSKQETSIDPTTSTALKEGR